MLTLPAKETFRRAVRRSECYDAVKAKYGPRVAQSRFRGIGPGLTATRILEIACMDHTVLDAVIVLDPRYRIPVGRPWLTTLIDVRSFCILGFVISFEGPTNYAAAECIRRANYPKMHLGETTPNGEALRLIFGKPEELVVDNGREFAGKSFQDACADVAINLRLAPVASPTHKAVVERCFRTLVDLLIKQLPGAVYDRKLMNEMGYDPENAAVLGLDELEELLWDAVSLYHVRKHRTLGETPLAVWQRDSKIRAPAVIGDADVLLKALGKVVFPRTLSTSGVELLGLRYHDALTTNGLLHDLVPGQNIKCRRRGGSVTVKVKVKYNAADISKVYVYNSANGQYIELPCVQSEYAKGMTEWVHEQVKAYGRLQGYAPCTETEWLEMRAQLCAKVEQWTLSVRGGSGRKVSRRMLNSPRIDDQSAHPITLAFAPARHDGMGSVIEHDVMGRSDDGVPPTRPPAKKRPVPKDKRGVGNLKVSPTPKLKSSDLGDWCDLDGGVSWEENENEF